MYNSIRKRKLTNSISFEEFSKMLERDSYFNSKEALDLGLIDEELTSKFN